MALEHRAIPLEFWSNKKASITITNTAADIALGNVVVSLPEGVDIERVVAMFMCRALENKCTTSALAISGAQKIQVKESTAGSWTDAIDLVDNLWTIAKETREMGDAIMGDYDIKGEVKDDGTYCFQAQSALVDYSHLEINDLQVGVRVYLR